MARQYYRLLIRMQEMQPHCTLDEVAHELGITCERVRQLEARALWKLRQGLLARGYCAADFLDGDGSSKNHNCQ